MKQGNQAMARNPAEAQRLFEAALRLKPGRVEPVKRIADSLAAQGKTDEARRQYLYAVQLHDRYGPAFIGLARLYVKTGDAARARTQYQRYLDVNPDGSDAKEARDFLESGR